MNTPNFEWGHSRDYSKQYLDAQKLKDKKIYRINIYSKDVVSGNLRDGLYQLDLPDMIQDVEKYHIAVEEAVFFTQSAATGADNRTFVFDTSIVQPDSYSTSSRTNSRVLFSLVRSNTTGVPVAYYKAISSNTIGIPVTDLTFFRNKQIQIRVRNAADVAHDDTTLPVANSGWYMTLVVYPFSP